MNTTPHNHPDDRLDAFLDGTLDADQMREFQDRLNREPELKRQADLQARINASLRRCCEAPDAERLLAEAQAASTGRRPAAGLLHRYGRLAAIILIGATLVTAAMWYADPFTRSTTSSRYKIIGLDASYQKLVDEGFQPDWRCETDEEFASTYFDRLNQPFVLAALPGNVEALGLSYSPAISRRTIALLAKVDGEPVVVFADREPPPDGARDQLAAMGLNMFQRQVGEITLCEVTAAQKPAVLNALVVPENMPTCPTQP